MWYVLVKVMSEFSAQAHAGKDLNILRFPQNIAAVHDSHLQQSAFQPMLKNGSTKFGQLYHERMATAVRFPILHRIDSGPENTAYYHKVLRLMSALAVTRVDAMNNFT